MKGYVLYVPRDAVSGDPLALDASEVVKDGIAWWALIFPLIWFLWNRLWLGALAVIASTLVLGAICYLLGIRDGSAALAHLALTLFFALEANQIRAWTLQRRGYVGVDAVLERRRGAAEAKLFARWLASQGDRPAAVAKDASATSSRLAPAPAAFAGAVPIVGLFPQPEGGR